MIQRNSKGQFIKGYKSWCKGIKGLIKANKTSFKKGHKLGKRFKKGHTPWCKGRKRPDIIMEKHPRWNGGIIHMTNGYLMQYVSSRHYRLQHRIVMENFIGRKLSFNEIVHHIDGNKTNNNLENLRLMSRSEHTRLFGYNSHMQNTR